MSEKRRILMLENDAIFVSKIRRNLIRNEIEIDQAVTEDEAISLLKVNNYDLLTVDFVLNNQDGKHDLTNEIIINESQARTKFIQKLRKDKVLLPIVILSAYSLSTTKVLEIGANSYISKKSMQFFQQEINDEIRNGIPFLEKEYQKKTMDTDILNKLITAYEQSNLSRFAFPYRQKRKDLEYKQLLKQKLCINGIYIENLVSFEEVEWQPQPNINILLGNNGFGKTFLSRILLALMCDGNYALQFFNIPTKITEGLDPREIKASIKIEVENGEEEPILIDQSKAFFNSATPKIPILAIPDVRTFDKGRKQLPMDIQEDIIGNSAKAYIKKRPFNNTVLHLLNLLCGYYRRTKGKHPIFRVLKEVYCELIGDDSFEFVKVGKAKKQDNNIYVKSSFTNYEIIKLQDASQGTLSVMVIFGLIYQYLELKNKIAETEDASKSDGIVFIDEIDSHLHPSWQQKIVPLLRKHFKNVQFFLNSHSPLVVMGCLEKEISRLEKEGEKITLKQFEEDFIGYTTQRLYDTAFGIEDKEWAYMDLARIWMLKKPLKKEIDALKEKKQLSTITIAEGMRLRKKENELKKIESFEEARKYRRTALREEILIEQLQRMNYKNRQLEDELIQLKSQMRTAL